MKHSLRIYLLLTIFCISAGCKDDDDIPAPGRGQLVATTEIGKLSKAQVIEYVDDLPLEGIAGYDVTYHTITYRTETEGSPIDSRGLLILPDGLKTAPLLVYFHGTLLPLKSLMEKETPSLYAGKKEDFREVRTMGLSFASAGYAVFLPDYIGYGATDDKEHPYVYYPEMFKSNIDGMLAVQEFLNSQGFSNTKRIFLTGWSQGGGASLSAHKYIQESYADKFEIIASSELAGPFNYLRFAGEFFSKRDENQGVGIVVSWSIYAMNKFSGIKRPTDQIWSFPVADQVSSILLPSKVPEKSFNNTFIAGINKGSDAAFIAEFTRNTIHEGWKPTGKVFLHHADTDKIVPYFNSQDAYNGLRAAGGDVKLYTYSGGDHDTELDNFVSTTLTDFKTLR
jgi:dienelactone hydrolase